MEYSVGFQYDVCIDGESVHSAWVECCSFYRCIAIAAEWNNQ